MKERELECEFSICAIGLCVCFCTFSGQECSEFVGKVCRIIETATSGPENWPLRFYIFLNFVLRLKQALVLELSLQKSFGYIYLQ